MTKQLSSEARIIDSRPAHAPSLASHPEAAQRAAIAAEHDRIEAAEAAAYAARLEPRRDATGRVWVGNAPYDGVFPELVPFDMKGRPLSPAPTYREGRQIPFTREDWLPENLHPYLVAKTKRLRRRPIPFGIG